MLFSMTKNFQKIIVNFYSIRWNIKNKTGLYLEQYKLLF